MHPDPSCPVDLRDLDYGEHLVLWSFRALASGRGECPVTRREFDHACGALAGEARNALFVFVQQLAMRGRRSITLAPPGCLSITRDEQLLLALFAAAQANDEDRFSAHFSWLAAAPNAPPFFEAARVFTVALGLKGHRLRSLMRHGAPVEYPPEFAPALRSSLRVVA
jgi:hypothetical protein